MGKKFFLSVLVILSIMAVQNVNVKASWPSKNPTTVNTLYSIDEYDGVIYNYRGANSINLTGNTLAVRSSMATRFIETTFITFDISTIDISKAKKLQIVLHEKYDSERAKKTGIRFLSIDDDHYANLKECEFYQIGSSHGEIQLKNPGNCGFTEILPDGTSWQVPMIYKLIGSWYPLKKDNTVGKWKSKNIITVINENFAAKRYLTVEIGANSNDEYGEGIEFFSGNIKNGHKRAKLIIEY